MTQFRCSVVIATRDRPLALQACIHSIKRAISRRDEIIVVDSASADPEAVRKVAVESDVRLVRMETGGSAAARNVGIQQARGEFIAFTDDDAVVDDKWLDAALGRFSDPTVSVVVGPVFELGAPSPTLLISFRGFDAARDRVRFSREGPDWFSRLRHGAIGCGANLIARTSTFQRHGKFREGLGRGAPIIGDENYFLLTVVDEGGVVVNEPVAYVHHPPQTAGRQHEVRLGSGAYIGYILLTRPHLLGLMCSTIATRTPDRASNPISPARSLGSVLASICAVPKALLEAILIDRAAASRPGFKLSEEDRRVEQHDNVL